MGGRRSFDGRDGAGALGRREIHTIPVRERVVSALRNEPEHIGSTIVRVFEDIAVQWERRNKAMLEARRKEMEQNAKTPEVSEKNPQSHKRNCRRRVAACRCRARRLVFNLERRDVRLQPDSAIREGVAGKITRREAA